MNANSQRYNASEAFHWYIVVMVMVVDVKVQNKFRISRLTGSISHLCPDWFFIRNAKGNKDRVVPFPNSLKVYLRTYIKIYKPKEYLFEGTTCGVYSPASLRAVFNKAKSRAGIKKPVTLHGLRHAYATHLMDAGTDVRIIKELLGHNDIKTTLIYTHVTQVTLENIPSPLDLL